MMMFTKGHWMMNDPIIGDAASHTGMLISMGCTFRVMYIRRHNSLSHLGINATAETMDRLLTIRTQSSRVLFLLREPEARGCRAPPHLDIKKTNKWRASHAVGHGSNSIDYQSPYFHATPWRC